MLETVFYDLQFHGLDARGKVPVALAVGDKRGLDSVVMPELFQDGPAPTVVSDAVNLALIHL
ncbi:hypothetical protein DSECCO2_638580 [anaerobic digester metagenome]